RISTPGLVNSRSLPNISQKKLPFGRSVVHDKRTFLRERDSPSEDGGPDFQTIFVLPRQKARFHCRGLQAAGPLKLKRSARSIHPGGRLGSTHEVDATWELTEEGRPERGVVRKRSGRPNNDNSERKRTLIGGWNMAVARSDDGSGNVTRKRAVRKPVEA